MTQSRDVEVAAAQLAAFQVIRAVQQHAASSLPFFTLARQRLHRPLKVGRHHFLHGIAVETDQSTHEGDRQQILTALLFLLGYDLLEDLARIMHEARSETAQMPANIIDKTIFA